MDEGICRELQGDHLDRSAPDGVHDTGSQHFVLTFVATVFNRFPFDFEHPEPAFASPITSVSVARGFWFFAVFLYAT